MPRPYRPTAPARWRSPSGLALWRSGACLSGARAPVGSLRLACPIGGQDHRCRPLHGSANARSASDAARAVPGAGRARPGRSATCCGNRRIRQLPAAAQPTGNGVITLTSQDPWVQTSSIPIRLGLKVHSSVPASDLLVSVALYTEPDGSALASRDEFDATLAGQFAGLSQLPPATFAAELAGKRQRLRRALRRRLGPAWQDPGDKRLAGQVFQLPCPQRSGGCDGVYPLQVSLDDTLTGHAARLVHDLPDRRAGGSPVTKAAPFLVHPAGRRDPWRSRPPGNPGSLPCRRSHGSRRSQAQRRAGQGALDRRPLRTDAARAGPEPHARAWSPRSTAGGPRALVARAIQRCRPDRTRASRSRRRAGDRQMQRSRDSVRERPPRRRRLRASMSRRRRSAPTALQRSPRAASSRSCCPHANLQSLASGQPAVGAVALHDLGSVSHRGIGRRRTRRQTAASRHI